MGKGKSQTARALVMPAPTTTRPRGTTLVEPGAVARITRVLPETEAGATVQRAPATRELPETYAYRRVDAIRAAGRHRQRLTPLGREGWQRIPTVDEIAQMSEEEKRARFPGYGRPRDPRLGGGMVPVTNELGQLQVKRTMTKAQREDYKWLKANKADLERQAAEHEAALAHLATSHTPEEDNGDVPAATFHRLMASAARSNLRVLDQYEQNRAELKAQRQAANAARKAADEAAGIVRPRRTRGAGRGGRGPKVSAEPLAVAQRAARGTKAAPTPRAMEDNAERYIQSQPEGAKRSYAAARWDTMRMNEGLASRGLPPASDELTMNGIKLAPASRRAIDRALTGIREQGAAQRVALTGQVDATAKGEAARQSASSRYKELMTGGVTRAMVPGREKTWTNMELAAVHPDSVEVYEQPHSVEPRPWTRQTYSRDALASLLRTPAETRAAEEKAAKSAARASKAPRAPRAPRAAKANVFPDLEPAYREAHNNLNAALRRDQNLPPTATPEERHAARAAYDKAYDASRAASLAMSRAIPGLEGLPRTIAGNPVYNALVSGKTVHVAKQLDTGRLEALFRLQRPISPSRGSVYLYQTFGPGGKIPDAEYPYNFRMDSGQLADWAKGYELVTGGKGGAGGTRRSRKAAE